MNYYQKEEFQSMLNQWRYQIIINFRNFDQKSVSTFHKNWAVEKKMKSCFDIKATATDSVNGIGKIMLEFMITQITDT